MSQRSASPYSDRNSSMPNKKKKIIKLKLDENQKISQQGQCKITNFFKNIEKRPKLEPKPVQKVIMRLQAQLQHLKEQQNRLVCQKQQMLQEQTDKKIQFESWIRRSKQLVQDCVKKIHSYARQRKSEIDPEKGFYDANCRIFTQGIYGQYCEMRRDKLKNSIQNEEYSNEEQQQMLNEMLETEQRRLQQCRKQMHAYKQRLKISYQQKSCKFAQKWPLLENRYQILELIGKGGFSQVYKAYDLDENKYIAVKMSQTSGFKSQIAHYIVREYENHIKLQHPNIAKLHSVIEVNPGSVCIILQYCEGPQLSAYIKDKKRVSQQKAKYILKQILQALLYLSSLNPKIIHYDLKPQNIMFSGGKIKILDFGLSRQIDNQHSRIALSNQGIGTYWYLPPESFNEKNPQISQKVDIWSAGVIFYEMLFGRRPFGHNKSQTTIFQEGTILQANHVEFPDDVEISDNAKSLIRRCLAYNVSERYTPAQALSHRFFQ